MIIPPGLAYTVFVLKTTICCVKIADNNEVQQLYSLGRKGNIYTINCILAYKVLGNNRRRTLLTVQKEVNLGTPFHVLRCQKWAVYMDKY
jgi:hypothetical protein